MRGWQHAHCYTTPTSINEYRADLPLAVNVVLQKALAKNPHERYPTVQAFALDLLNASQEITQQLDRPSISVLSSGTRFRPLPGNVQANEQVLVELQPRPIGVSLAHAPATEPIAIPIIPAPIKHATSDQKGLNKTLLHEAYIATPKTPKSSSRWIWCALTLNLFIIVMLSIEYTLKAGSPGFSFRPLLTLCPALLVGLLLALLFKRISLTTLSWSLFWGMFFGMTNALLSLFACMICYALLLVVQFQGSIVGGLSGFFGPSLQFVSDSRAIVLLLLALWVSVTGGAIIGIFNMQANAQGKYPT